MATSTFNLSAEAERKLFAVYVDVSQTGTSEWEIQGYGTEDAVLSFSLDEETKTDILGIQHNRVNKIERSMEIGPNTIRPVESAYKGKLNPVLHEYMRRNDIAKLSSFKVLFVYYYIGDETGGFEADLYPSCQIAAASLGGSSYVEFPYNIKPGGEAQYGKAKRAADGTVTFTPEA